MSSYYAFRAKILLRPHAKMYIFTEVPTNQYLSVYNFKDMINIRNPSRSDKACSVANCRKILLNQLRNMMPNGALNDIRLIKVLNECGDDTIFKVKDLIKSIRIEDFNVPKYDQILLVSMIRKCSPLDDVYVQQFHLNPTLLKLSEGCHEQVEKYQVTGVIIA